MPKRYQDLTMLNYLSAFPSPVQIAIHVIGFVALTYILMLAIHRALSFELRRQHNDVIGFIIAVVAVFYGLIIASVLIICINRFDHGQQAVEDEANLIADVVRNATAISPQVANPVTQLAVRYLDEVVTKEWPAQVKGQRIILRLKTLHEITLAISRYEPRNQREATFYLHLIQTLDKLYDARRQRIFLAGEKLAGEVWVVTLAGAILTICFALLFGVQNRRIHLLLASFLAVSLALIFALLTMFDSPFQGDVSVSDEPFRLIRQQLTT
jgi:multisubunit Na+/H+ antiporter MnhB subunit